MESTCTAAPVRSILQLIYDDAQALDITGPLEVFSLANEFVRERKERTARSYRITLVAEKVSPITLSSGLRLLPDYCFDDLPECRPLNTLDTFLIPGGNGVQAARNNRNILDFIRNKATVTRRVASVCSGTFLLAEAGLLAGKTVTTHWQVSARLAREFPELQVEPDRIYTRDGRIYTSAGITAGIDLALSMVEDDLGRQASLNIAKELVVYMKRHGGQAQFSKVLNLQQASPSVMGDIITWIQTSPSADLSIPVLAAKTGMSERHFSRKFRAETGYSPGVFIEKTRVEYAARLIENSSDGLKSIAADSGFANDEMMRRAFKRHYKVLPHLYRRRFGR